MSKTILFVLYFCHCCLYSISNSEEVDNSEDKGAIKEDLNRNGDKNTTYVMISTESSPEETLQDLEDNLKKLIGGLVSRLYPSVSGSGIPSDVSMVCLLTLANIYYGFKKLEPWAFELVDSFGKLSDGMLEGTSTALGDYDQCLDVAIEPQYLYGNAKYCLLEIKPPETIIKALKEYQINKDKEKTSLAVSKSFLGFLRKVKSNPDHVMFRMGICMPVNCGKDDIQNLVDMVTERINIEANIVRCHKKETHSYKVHEILIIVFLCNIIALTIVGTMANFFCQNGVSASDNSSLEPGPNALKFKSRWRLSKLFQVLSKFSVQENVKKLLNCTEECDALDAIRGIKVLTVISTIYAHTYALPHPLHLYRFRDTLNFSKFIDEVLFGTVANSSVGVDTFFFIAGFLFIYYRWRLLKKPAVGRYILKFLGVNYLRLLAAQFLVIFLFALLPIFGSGPLFEEFVQQPLQNCAKTWWMNLLFIQNFLGPYDSCLYHTWILATMMQLFVLTSFVVWLMHRKPVIGLSANYFIIVAAAIAVAAVTFLYDFPATFTVYFYDFRTSIKYWKYLYVQSYNHVGPFCIGMLIAYYTAEYPPKKCRKIVAVSLWAASIVTFGAIVFGLYQYREDQDMNRVLAVFYSTLHRPAWALALAWVVYACATDNGGFINSILSWKAVIPLERLCYLAFLFHIPLMYYHGGVQRERMYMGHYNQIMSFFSYLVTSFLLSSVCYVLFQAPYQTIEHYIFGIQKESIWETKSVATSAENLKNEDGENKTSEVDNSKVLYNRYVQNDTF